MSTIYFVTHPEVVIAPQRPVPRWHLSDDGILHMNYQTWPRMVTTAAAAWRCPACTTTLAPARANSPAIARPIPPEAPVTTAT